MNDIVAKILLEHEQFSASMSKIENEVKGLQNQLKETTQTGSQGFSGMGSILGSAAVMGGIIGLTSALKGVWNAGREAMKSANELYTGFRSAGMSADQARIAVEKNESSAKKLSLTYLVNKEDIERLTATYLKFGGTTDDLGKKQELIIGLSKRAGIGYEMAAKALSKGTDPMIEAQLTRMGIKFEKGATEAERFQIISEKIAPTLQGMKDAANTTEGKLEGMSIQFDENKKAIGKMLIEGVTPLLNALLQNAQPIMQGFMSVIHLIAENMNIVLPIIIAVSAVIALNYVSSMVAAAAATWAALAPMLPFIAAAALLTVGIYALAGGFEKSTEDRKHELDVQHENIETEKNELNAKKDLEDGNKKLIDSTIKLTEKSHLTAKEHKTLQGNLNELHKTYPNVITDTSNMSKVQGGLATVGKEAADSIAGLIEKLKGLSKQERDNITASLKNQADMAKNNAYSKLETLIEGGALMKGVTDFNRAMGQFVIGGDPMGSFNKALNAMYNAAAVKDPEKLKRVAEQIKTVIYSFKGDKGLQKEEAAKAIQEFYQSLSTEIVAGTEKVAAAEDKKDKPDKPDKKDKKDKKEKTEKTKETTTEKHDDLSEVLAQLTKDDETIAAQEIKDEEDKKIALLQINEDYELKLNQIKIDALEQQKSKTPAQLAELLDLKNKQKLIELKYNDDINGIIKQSLDQQQHSREQAWNEQVAQANGILDRLNSESIKADQKAFDAKVEQYQLMGSALQEITEQAVKGQEKMGKVLLKVAKQTFMMEIPLIIAKIWGEELGSKGLLGSPFAIAATAILTGLVAAIPFKSGVTDLMGPGTTTSDSIPARLSVHESVTPAAGTLARGRYVDNIDVLEFMKEGKPAEDLIIQKVLKGNDRQFAFKHSFDEVQIHDDYIALQVDRYKSREARRV